MKNKRHLMFFLAFIILFTFLLTACGGSPSYNLYNGINSSKNARTQESYSYDRTEANITQTSNEERRKTKSYNIGADTREFNTTYSEIKKLISKNNGYVDSSSYFDSNKKNVSLAAFIPKDNVENFLTKLKEIKTLHLLEEREYSNDLENAYTDVETRLNVLEKRLAKLQELQENQSDISTIIEIEDRISETVNEIERLKGNKQSLDKSVEYSRFDIYLEEVYKADENKDKLETKFSDDFKDTIKETKLFYRDLGRLLIYIAIKYSLVAIVIGIIIYFANKNNKKKKTVNQREEKTENYYKENKK